MHLIRPGSNSKERDPSKLPYLGYKVLKKDDQENRNKEKLENRHFINMLMLHKKTDYLTE